MSDEHFVKRLKAGDREAAREMIRLYYPSVLRFMTTICANSADAEELTQDAFVNALQAVQRFRGESSLRTWLHRIAFHEFTRRRRRERLTSPLPESAWHPIFETNCLLALELERALKLIPAEFTTAFVLCDVLELTMAEASEVLSVPVGTVKSRLHNARSRLQVLLRSEQEEKAHV